MRASPGTGDDLTTKKILAKDYVSERRKETVCEDCGGGPIEWHREEHLKKPSRRVSNMAMRGYLIPTIAAEIAECQALCRSCHMGRDGRTSALLKTRMKITASDAVAIRKDPRSSRKVAPEYGITSANVRRIRLGLTWKNL